MCDINNCHWKWGMILKDTDDVNNADCDCSTTSAESDLNFPKENSQNLWICPRHCHAMPQINMQVTLETSKVTWTKRDARMGESFKSPYDGLHKSPTLFYQFQVADRSSVSTTRETFTVILPGATCDSGGTNCHRFQKREGWEDDVADSNVYSLRSPESCLQTRYGSNWNARILSCRQWKPPGGEFPYMVHFNDNFWPAEPTNIHNFDTEQKGWKSNQKTVSQCPEVGFKATPCWAEGTTNNLMFSIKPFYTAYRHHNPKGDKTLCRMLVHGPVQEDSTNWGLSYFTSRTPVNEYLLPYYMEKHAQYRPAWVDEWKASTYWESPPHTAYHEYYQRSYSEFYNLVKTVRPDLYNTNKGEVKKYNYNFQCMNGNTPGPSGQALYYHSGCISIECIDFMTKPCYDNVYRFDDMVCKLVTDGFSTAMSFQKFVDKTVPEQRYRDAFMSYGRYPRSGPSYFQISFDNTKIDVIKDGHWPVQPNQAIDFLPHSTILVTTKPMLSCSGCKEKPLHGRANTNEAVLLHNIIRCRACSLFERIQIATYHNDCKLCVKHQIRNPADDFECVKCKDMNASAPMRRAPPHPQTDDACTTCQLFQYFDEDSNDGCIFLKTVTDKIVVTNKKAKLSGQDYYIKDDMRKEIDFQFYRDRISASTPWTRELEPQPCKPGFQEPIPVVKRLKFTAWCGHQEMDRHDQAWVQVDSSSLYMPLNSDQARTRSNTSVVELCGNSTLTPVYGKTTVDLACGRYTFGIIRSGFQDACTLCVGARYTKNCWPTYVRELKEADDIYFASPNESPQPGTCASCNAVCNRYTHPDHFIDPIEYSCWWNGTGRVPGVLGATATNFSWYKLAPCSPCNNVKLTADTAEIVLTCGNRISYRRWLSDAVSDSSEGAPRSIPSIQICCAEPLTVRQCTDDAAEFNIFARDSCSQSVSDSPRVLLKYCPPGWYVDPVCAQDSDAWSPDCCVRCKSCRGGKFKTDEYYDCPGHQFFDSQDRGCTTSCLTNQYLRNERCIKCEACE